MSDTVHRLLLASAGTGKTYRLTNQFLGLLLAGVEPERILATTFTRKAAGEILDRVLERLVDAVEKERELEALREGTGQGAAVSAEACRGLLRKLTRSLDSFQVRTLDSFFAYLVRLFALDLELPPDWTLADEREGEALRTAAIQDVLEGAEREEMVALLRDLQKGGAARGVQEALMGHARKLRAIHLDSEEGAWSTLRGDGAGTPFSDSDLDAAKRALEQAPLATTKAGKEMASWVKARNALLDALEARRWSEVFTKGLGAASLKDEPLYYKKPLDPALLAALEPLVAYAKTEVLNELIAGNEALHDLLVRFEACYARRMQESGRFGFDDLPLALAPDTARARLFDEREEDLWFRLDGRLDHLLLDEFQDTAPVQWRILAPLASEIAANSEGQRSFFCVGDPKQSIYGFRQAEPRLLRGLDQLLPGLVPESMHTSYRSSSVILDFVNRIFGDVLRNRAFEGEEREPYREAAYNWSRSFELHEAARDLPGRVFVVEAEQHAEGERVAAPALRAAVERVAEIVAEAPGAEVGVLTRVNKDIPALIHALRKRGIDASGEGGNPLTDSEAVLVFVSLLHLADHPSDSAAAFHVASSPLGRQVGLVESEGADGVRRAARALRRRLLDEGLGRTTEAIARGMLADDSWTPWDRTRLGQLVDQAHAFEDRFTIRTRDFIDHLRTHRVEAPGGARVRVMTVHASKGLEFDAVVLPELSAGLAGRRDQYLTHRPHPTGLIQEVMRSPHKDYLVLSPKLRALYDLSTCRSVEDSLCVLYVALTRAKRRLDLILPWIDPDKASEGTAPTFADLVRAALPSGEAPEATGTEGEARVLWASPPADWAPRSEPRAAEDEVPEPRLQLAESTSPRAVRRSAPSDRGLDAAQPGGAAVAVAELLASEVGAEVGTLAHGALEACEWIEDFTLDRAGLEARASSAGVGRAACQLVESALASAEIRAALSRETCGAPAGCDLRVERERSYSLLMQDSSGEEQLCNGSIDRLVIAEKDGRPVWAEVIDYKSDRVAEGELEERARHHSAQVESYARVVAHLTGLAPDRIRTRLAFLSPGRMVDLAVDDAS